MANSCCVSSTVIASAAKQSRGHSMEPLDCFVARAPRNDGNLRYSRSQVDFLDSGRHPNRGNPLDREHLVQSHGAYHRRRIESLPWITTTTTRSAPRTTFCRKVLSVASRLKTLKSEPTKRTPISVPTTPPTPPVSCVPLRATTVIALSSRPRP